MTNLLESAMVRLLESSEGSMSKVFDFIFEYQERKGISGNKLAELMGFDPSYISLLRNGKRRITSNVLDRFLEAFPEYRHKPLNRFLTACKKFYKGLLEAILLDSQTK